MRSCDLIPWAFAALLFFPLPVFAETATASLAIATASITSEATPSAIVSVPEKTSDKILKADVIYTGFTNGFAKGRAQINEIDPLFDESIGRNFSLGSPKNSFGVFRCGKYFIFSPEGPLTYLELKAFLEGEVEILDVGEKAEKVSVLNSDYSVIFQYPQQEKAWLTGWLWEINRESGKYPDQDAKMATVFTLKGKDRNLFLLSLGNEVPDAKLLGDPGVWEISPLATATATKAKRATNLYAFGKVFGDGLRRRELIKGMLAQKGPGTILVDAGNLINQGNSDLDQAERAITLEALADIHYDAVLPYENELSLERPLFERMAKLVPFVCANLQSKSVSPVLRYVIKDVRGVKVGITGVTDDRALAEAGLVGGKTSWTASDPFAEAKAVVGELKEAGVDFIVMLANLPDASLYRLRDQVSGIGAVVGQFSNTNMGLREEEIEVRDVERMRQPKAHLLAISGPEKVGFIEGRFREKGGGMVLEHILHTTRTIDDDLPSDAKLRLKIGLQTDNFYTARSETMLPDIRRVTRSSEVFRDEEGGYPFGMRGGLWSAMIANILKNAGGADVGIARRLPLGDSTVGDIPRFFVENWLDFGDRLVFCDIKGADLKRLQASDSKTLLLSFAGFDPEKQLVGGRKIEDKQSYRLATTDLVLKNALFYRVFEGKSYEDKFKKGNPSMPSLTGERLPVKDLVMSTLIDLKKRHPDFDDAYLEELKGLMDSKRQVVLPQLSLRLDELTLLFNNNQLRDQGDFGQVRSSRVNNPESNSLGGKIKSSVVYDNETLAWENKLKSAYTKLVLRPAGQAQISQESDDDITLASEFRLKFVKLELPQASMELVPFVNTNYDTEFTPTVDSTTNKTNPRQSEISGIGGLVLYPGSDLKEIRLGGLVRHDFATARGGVQPGVQVAANYEHRFGTENPLSFTLAMDTKQIFRTLEDTPEELGLSSNLVGTVLVPLWGGFNLNFTTDAFFFNGKLASNRNIGTNLKTLVGLSYSNLWKARM